MSCGIQNNSGKDMSALTGMVKQFYPYAQKYLGFDKPATIVYQSDPANAQDPLGKTAHYQPDNYTVTLYVDGRHPKDLLRSLAHELVHHTQNCRGDLCPEKMGEMGDGYAQTNGHLRKMEQEAYASMVMRDWEDKYKSKRHNNLKETIYINKEYITMSEHEQLIKRIVAEVMKEATVTTESEEEDETVEEGSGDRKDSRDNNQQGHRQRAASDGSPGQHLEEEKAGKIDRKDVANKATGRWLKEGDDEEDTEVQEEGFEKPKSATGSGPSAKAGKQDRKDVANQVPSGFVNENEDAADDNDETIEEADDGEETTDDLKETFQRRNNKLFEKLVRWSKE